MRSRFTTLTRLASVGVLSLTLGIAQLPSITARAQGDEQRASGPVVDLADGRATVATNTGPVVVQMGPSTQYERDTFGTLSDLQPGQYVGVTGRPTGEGLEAIEIRVFPALLSSVPQGQTPMSGPNAGNTMTNASIVSFDGGILTLQFADQRVIIVTTPATQVRLPGPAAADDVQAGERIVAAGPTGADGVLQARGVYVPAQ